MRNFRGSDLAASSLMQEMLPDIASVLRVYDAVHRLLAQANLAHLMEPSEHVIEVERLRCSYRPPGDVRLVMLGESHVRVQQESFQRRGPAFLYNERYYTPWWRYLFLPALAPVMTRTDREVRLKLLGQMQASGIWVLDACLVSLSGYKKIGISGDNRPFDALRREIIRMSWRLHVHRQFGELLKQEKQPVVCALGTVSGFLPQLPSGNPVRLNCITQANSAIYRSEAYRFGTRNFVQAVRDAGL